VVQPPSVTSHCLVPSLKFCFILNMLHFRSQTRVVRPANGIGHFQWLLTLFQERRHVAPRQGRAHDSGTATNQRADRPKPTSLITQPRLARLRLDQQRRSDCVTLRHSFHRARTSRQSLHLRFRLPRPKSPDSRPVPIQTRRGP
jgi:hypothetical protein